jgi:hypothetical protein
MDNELLELEAELKRLRPVPPSAVAEARVERALAVRRRNSTWAWWALPVAAALAGVIFFAQEKFPATNLVPPPVSAPVAVHPTYTYKPVSAQNVLYDLQDDGLVTLADGTTARRYRGSYVDTITWKNPHTQASLRWSVPRTVERVVPVSFQ